jgi:hypothetical protein
LQSPANVTQLPHRCASCIGETSRASGRFRCVVANRYRASPSDTRSARCGLQANCCSTAGTPLATGQGRQSQLRVMGGD